MGGVRTIAQARIIDKSDYYNTCNPGCKVAHTARVRPCRTFCRVMCAALQRHFRVVFELCSHRKSEEVHVCLVAYGYISSGSRFSRKRQHTADTILVASMLPLP